MRAGLVALLALALPAAIGAVDTVEAVVARASVYVEGYQKDFALVVSEERYEQEVRYPAPALTRGRDLIQKTVLRSDFLLVRDPGGMWVPFRDVFERDGVPVRDREERLSQLFLADPGAAFEQARRIVEESARYNLGSLNRNINVPTLALVFLTTAEHGRFEFSDRGEDDGARVLQFREIGRPTYISTTAGRDLPVSGRYWIDEASGRVERTEVTAADSSLDARIVVTYRPNAEAGLWVPEKMDEVYRQHEDRSEIRGTATYSRFRRFQVKTTEDVAQ
jgi:hypothetical protein